VERLLAHAPVAVDKPKYTDPHTKANALLQVRMSGKNELWGGVVRCGGPPLFCCLFCGQRVRPPIFSCKAHNPQTTHPTSALFQSTNATPQPHPHPNPNPTPNTRPTSAASP